MRVLIVEDNDGDAALEVRELRRLGHEVERVSSVHEALMIASGYRFEAIVVDIGLPDAELEFGLVSELRGRLGYGFPLIVCSGFDDDHRIRAAGAAGASGYVIKDDRHFGERIVKEISRWEQRRTISTGDTG